MKLLVFLATGTAAIFIALHSLGTFGAAIAATPVAVAPSDTPASEQAKRLLRAIDGDADDASFLQVIERVFPSSRLTPDQWLELRQQLRPAQFHRVEQATATRAELSMFHPDLEGWVHIIVTVEPNPPHAISDFSFPLGARPSDVPQPPKLTPAKLIAATRSEIAAAVARDRFAGAVLIARHGRPILAAAYGLADMEKRTPNTLNTQFRFASLGKMFTAVAIMQLAQAGKIDLAAPIGRYLKDYPNPDIAGNVTVDELMTHTGGTGSIFIQELRGGRELVDLKAYVTRFGARPASFAPGSRYEYSNYGFVLLGRIIEEVSGLSFDDYLRQHIFAPAGMTSTGMRPESEQLPRRATSYMSVNGQWRSAEATMLPRGSSWGGGYATVADLLRFGNALMSNRLLDAEHTKRLTTGGAVLPNGRFFPYDFGGSTTDRRPYIGHGGDAPGVCSDMRIFPGAGYTVIVLSNRDPPTAHGVAEFISDRLP